MVKLAQGNRSRRYSPGTVGTGEDLTRYLNDEFRELAEVVNPTVEGRHEDTWTDLRFPATQSRRGALNKPDFDYTNVGLLFPQNKPSEIIYLIGQMPHGYRPGTPLRPHLHWQQAVATAPTWGFEYKWYNVGDSVPASFTTDTSSSLELPYTSGNMHQISAFSEIDGAGMRESSILLMKVYRTDNAVSGDILVFELDLHYISEKTGTVPEFPS